MDNSGLNSAAPRGNWQTPLIVIAAGCLIALLGFGARSAYGLLLEPMTGDSPIARFLEKNGEGLHHVAFACRNVAEALKELKARGHRLIDEAPRPGAPAYVGVDKIGRVGAA